MGGHPLPAQDSLAELRAVISDHLKNFLSSNEEQPKDEKSQGEKPAAVLHEKATAVEAEKQTETEAVISNLESREAEAREEESRESAPTKSAQQGPFAPIESALAELREWRKSPRRLGVAQTAPAVSLRNEVASEIAARLHADPSKAASFDTTGIDEDDTDQDGPDTRVGVASSDEGMEHAGSGSPVKSLPLGARLKPRGIFEDDWTATLTPKRPWPVILIHGTADSKGIWQLLGSDLRQDGWAVFAPDYGTRATGLIPESAAQIGAYMQAVMHTTGAEQVIIIGHSQGGLVARYWMRKFGGAQYVKHLVCIGTPNHGTTQGGILSPLVTSRRADNVMTSIIEAYFGPAGAQQIVGSDILNEVNRDGDLDEGVMYTNIATRSDAVVVPPESCFLAPHKQINGTVRNIYVQDFDRRAVVLHHDLPVDKRVRVITRTILRQIGPMGSSSKASANPEKQGANPEEMN